MKKFFVSAALILMSLCFVENISARNFGVVGGANFHTYNESQTLTQWHAGLVYKVNLPIGFQIQPTLLYNVKAATTDLAPVDLSVGYLELMASCQWGVDLILFRPFVEVSPFIGYGLNGNGSLRELWSSKGDKLEYGVGLGGGLQIWRFQINARYNWNFGNVLPRIDSEGLFGKENLDCVTLSLAYFF